MSLEARFRDLVADEPPYVLRPEQAVRAGRRRRVASLTAVAAGVAALGAAALALPSATPPTSELQLGAPAEDRWTPVVRRHTPAAWTIDVLSSTDDGYRADVDDGRGAGQLAFGVSPHPGSLQRHPCKDAEFVAGGKCEERDLRDGRWLITQEAEREGGLRTVTVVVVHADGGGVEVTSSNATYPEVAPGTVFASGAEKEAATRGTVTRPAPLYDAQALTELALDLDAAPR